MNPGRHLGGIKYQQSLNENGQKSERESAYVKFTRMPCIPTGVACNSTHRLTQHKWLRKFTTLGPT